MARSSLLLRILGFAAALLYVVLAVPVVAEATGAPGPMLIFAPLGLVVVLSALAARWPGNAIMATLLVPSVLVLFLWLVALAEETSRLGGPGVSTAVPVGATAVLAVPWAVLGLRRPHLEVTGRYLSGRRAKSQYPGDGLVLLAILPGLVILGVGLVGLWSGLRGGDLTWSQTGLEVLAAVAAAAAAVVVAGGLPLLLAGVLFRIAGHLPRGAERRAGQQQIPPAPTYAPPPAPGPGMPGPWPYTPPPPPPPPPPRPTRG